MGSDADSAVVERVMADLSLDRKEEDGWRVVMARSSGVVDDDLCAMGSFLTTCVIKFKAIKTTLANLWHPHRGYYF
ncbi:hypothetical protein PVK06_030642 [Gossypium arboreum]|uniref:Uncharacterized protein n=1 Tax=Gossypium arboreum TaxID=29729 RepID=A0ABR0NNT0_GOSAR|nr:hypothetical protein PVK06_030642 [Gossypium arboreum]